jgi:hypothetical protein
MQARMALERADEGQEIKALNALLTLAAETVEALEDRIGAGADAGMDKLKAAVLQTADVKRETGASRASAADPPVGGQVLRGSKRIMKCETENKKADAPSRIGTPADIESSD